MLERLDTYDWEYAFEYAGVEPGSRGYGTPNVSAVVGWDGDASGFTREDVVEILAAEEGENDGPEWIGLFRLRDGRYAFLSASCDYTGWDCRAWGRAIIGPDLPTMIRLALGEHDRARLGLTVQP